MHQTTIFEMNVESYRHRTASDKQSSRLPTIIRRQPSRRSEWNERAPPANVSEGKMDLHIEQRYVGALTKPLFTVNIQAKHKTKGRIRRCGLDDLTGLPGQKRTSAIAVNEHTDARDPCRHCGPSVHRLQPWRT
jgi:hypothetical protein